MCQKRCLLKLAIEVKEEPSEPEDDQKSGVTDLDMTEAKLGQIMKGSEARIQSYREERINNRMVTKRLRKDLEEIKKE